MLKNGKATLCWPNYSNEAILSGGSWQPTLPLENMSTPQFSQVSRSVDTELSSTKFNVSLEKPRPVYNFSLANHSLSSNAKIRIRIYDNDSKATLFHDTNWVEIWPSLYSSSELEWEFDNFWFGTIEDEDRQNLTPLFYYFLPQAYVSSYLEVEIDDISNSRGYVTIGRLFISDAWQSKISASYGISYGWDIGTTFDTAIDQGMTEYADVKIPKRTVSFDLSTLTEEEGFSRIQRLRRTQGLHGEVLYTESPNQTTEGFSRTFIGRQESVDSLSHPYYRNYSTTIFLKEIL